jgi:hypothetical protein
MAIEHTCQLPVRLVTGRAGFGGIELCLGARFRAGLNISASLPLSFL